MLKKRIKKNERKRKGKKKECGGNKIKEIVPNYFPHKWKIPHYIHMKVRWSESRGSGKNRRTIHYHNEREYFSQNVVLWGNAMDSGADAPTMPAGAYSLPFNFLLPHNIPFSFEGNTGYTAHVRYTCKATIGTSHHVFLLHQINLLSIYSFDQINKKMATPSTKRITNLVNRIKDTIKCKYTLLTE